MIRVVVVAMAGNQRCHSRLTLASLLSNCSGSLSSSRRLSHLRISLSLMEKSSFNRVGVTIQALTRNLSSQKVEIVITKYLYGMKHLSYTMNTVMRKTTIPLVQVLISTSQLRSHFIREARDVKSLARSRLSYLPSSKMDT